MDKTAEIRNAAIEYVEKNASGFTKSGFAALVGYKNSAVLEEIIASNPLAFRKEGKRTIYNGRELNVGARVVSAAVPKVAYTEQLDHIESLTSALANGAFNSLFVCGRGGIGKTQTVEATLNKAGLKDGMGYFKISGTASPIGVYAALYNNRNGIVIFDDSDGVMMDLNARSLIKAATDTKKVRKLVWNKKSSFIFDPDLEGVDEDDEELGVEKFPRYFEFTGRVIFISNLSLDKLDPEGTIRTRSFIIHVNPTDSEIYDFMETIADKIELEGSNKMPLKKRLEVLEIVRNSKRVSDISIRKYVRALNLANAGIKNWEKLVDLYC